MSRAKQFAVDDVLAKAVHRFSTHGYHATSIRNLEQCMGIHRTSMYGAFGSKRGLFVSALRYHIERYGGALRAVVERESSPAAAIGGVFAGAIENGGFIIGTAVELAAHDDEIERLVAAVWRAVEYLFGTLIEEGQSAGEIAASVDPIEAGRALVGLYLGLGVHVLSGEPASGVVMQQVQAVLPAPGRR